MIKTKLAFIIIIIYLAGAQHSNNNIYHVLVVLELSWIVMIGAL